ncbi:MAG TPA: hypothetical protein VMZ66_00545 [Aeromicrobium sp.]|nr:hypothetical protein [Aeromicrobium sp.]
MTMPGDELDEFETGGYSFDSDEGGSSTAPGPMTTDPGVSTDPDSGGASDPGYSYDPESGGSSEPAPYLMDPTPSIPPEDLDGAWSADDMLNAADTVVTKVVDAFDSTPVSIAWEAGHMESDETPDQRSARNDYETREELDQQMSDDRTQQLTQNLPPHVVEMDAPAEPEYDAPIDEGELDGVNDIGEIENTYVDAGEVDDGSTYMGEVDDGYPAEY